MCLCAIVADDLTGANTAGVLLTKAGFKILTIVQDDRIESFEVTGVDGVVVNAMSRGLSGEEARLKVEKDTRALKEKGGKYFCKRVDSTIRGNLGAEVEGMLDALGPEYVAVCVPSYPASGKITIGGYLLVNAVPVARTVAGRDPIKPVKNSYLPNVFAEQTGLGCGVIPLATVAKGTDAIIAALSTEVAEGKRIVVVDSASEADIEVVAHAVAASGIKAVSVDPGPFTQALFSRYVSVKKVEKITGKVLVVSGSVSDLTRSQLDYLEKECGARLISVDVRLFLDGGYDEEICEGLARAAAEASARHDVFGFRVAETADMVLDLEGEAASRGISLDEISRRITCSLASLAKRALELADVAVKGVYLTGGDVTVAFCSVLGAHAIELEDEIIPHISYGCLRGGRFSGLKVTTKGGFIGAGDTAWQCIKYMTER
ncbi:MAG: four-carbon acid sugar kinase family protein [Negativicutes bacterium]|nr:four-carbon acid sugar kinase family protein [Negativicutes bacterium]